MADFTISNTTKSAVRKLATSLTDMTAFDNLVQGVITNNPFQCVSYNAQGLNHPQVERSKQGYTARINYQDADAKIIALITIRIPTIAATLKCHDTNGEIYFVNFSRNQVTLTSFSDDAIRSRVEIWADTGPALG